MLPFEVGGLVNLQLGFIWIVTLMLLQVFYIYFRPQEVKKRYIFRNIDVLFEISEMFTSKNNVVQISFSRDGLGVLCIASCEKFYTLYFIRLYTDCIEDRSHRTRHTHLNAPLNYNFIIFLISFLLYKNPIFKF